MSDTAHIYIRPDTANTTALPAQVAAYLDGTNLLAKTQALRIGLEPDPRTKLDDSIEEGRRCVM
jgi:hypothetical protein